MPCEIRSSICIVLSNCRMSFWVWFSETLALQLQELRIFFRTDIELFRSFVLQMSLEFEALKASFSFPIFSSTVLSNDSLLLLYSLDNIF